MPAHAFRLVPFAVPGAPSGANAASLDIEITGTIALDAGTVNVTYRISGATDRVKYASASAQPARKHELWRTTCFELFLRSPASVEYWEVNLAPSRDWNVYRFTTYRSALQQEPDIADIMITTEVAPAGLTSVRATLPLPPSLVGQKLAVGISSVIQERSGEVHYFALRHGGTKPDFHDPAGFDIKLDPTSA